jgi:uroporphyrinogen decarboxylase
MNEEKWSIVEKCANFEELETVPVCLIVDSPWIPGHTDVSTMDYFTNHEIWLEANLAVEKEFPEAIFLPGFWVELGMAAEPSGFGCKISFYPDTTPNVHPLLNSVEEVVRISAANPRTDGLMPLILNFYRTVQCKVADAGHIIKIVAARGPLAIASHLLGVTNFLVGLKLDPENTHRLLKITTATAKNWLEAQADVLQDVEGIMLLDDLVGFLSPQDYLEFAHPYMKEIFDAFAGSVKFLHNDMDNPVSFPYLQELGLNIFNFSHKIPMNKAKQLVGPRVCLMGNVAPLEVLGEGTPDMVLEEASRCLQEHPGRKGLILSAGGGVSPGTPGENIAALIQAVQHHRMALA